MDEELFHGSQGKFLGLSLLGYRYFMLFAQFK
jgi:hypothetical protein